MRLFWEKNRKICIFFAVAGGLFLVLRFLIPLLFPFVAGAFLTVILRPAVHFLHKKTRIGKGIWAVICLAVLLFLSAVPICFLGYGLIEKISAFMRNYEVYTALVTQKAGNCCQWLEEKLYLRDGMLMGELERTMVRLSDSWKEKGIPGFFKGSFGSIKMLASAGAFLVFTFLSAVFFLKEWEQPKEGWLKEGALYGRKVLDFIKIFLGAQIKIIGIIGLICLLGFWISGESNPLGMAVMAAFLDILPLVGTGIVLLPLAVWRIICGKYSAAFWLIVTYICCMIAREYLEPKLISAKTGISPLLTLLGIYVGIQLAGFSGIILGPLYVVLLHVAYKEIIAKEEMTWHSSQ